MTDKNNADVTHGEATVNIDLDSGYRFVVDFGEDFDPFAMDEPVPLGSESAPNASRVLGAAVGNCLSASLLFCFRKAHIEVQALHTEVQVKPVRNDAGRLRVGSINVALHPQISSEADGRVERCLRLFEDFCVVTQAVRDGIAVDVKVVPEHQ